MSGKLIPIAASLASAEPAKPDKPGEYVARLLKTSPPLDDEIRRLVSIHGWEAVAKTSKRLAKPNKRREMLREDWKILGPILKEEAARILRGEKPRKTSTIAALALPHVRKTDDLAGTRRLRLRLDSEWRREVQAICTIDIAEDSYPWRVLLDICSRKQPTDFVTEYAFDALQALDRAITGLKAAGQPIAEDATAAELKAANSKLLSTKAASVLTGGWLKSETN
jgi:hypothetical protein